jgi:hypothetical protein
MFPSISPQFQNMATLSPPQIDTLLATHCQVTVSACDMFVETLNFNTGPLGNNTLARELHLGLKQYKVDNDFLLTSTMLSETGMDMLLKCSDRLLLAFKQLQDYVERERHSSLTRMVGAEQVNESADQLEMMATSVSLTKPGFNASEKGKSVASDHPN